jgi:hypothetical protein
VVQHPEGSEQGLTRAEPGEVYTAMEDQAGQPAQDEATQEQILQFMTTEHFTLQTAKSATVAEANGRASLFLSTVSSAVVALAFIGQVSGIGRAFFLFGLVLFPSLLFLGFVTFERAIQTAIENMVLSRGINRLRHYFHRRYQIHKYTEFEKRLETLFPSGSQ